MLIKNFDGMLKSFELLKKFAKSLKKCGTSGCGPVVDTVIEKVKE